MTIWNWLGVTDAYAAAGGQASADSAQGGLLSVLPLLVIFFVIFYFLLIRPQNKRAKEHRDLLSKLAEGDEVSTTGGILGRIKQVDENFVTLQVAQNVELVLRKQAVADQMPKGTIENF